MIPQESIIEATDLQAAHNRVSEMMRVTAVKPDEFNTPQPKVHSIIELKEADPIDFGPSPAA